MKPTRISAHIAAAALLCSCAGRPAQPVAESLKEAYSDAFKIGVAVTPGNINGWQPESEALILRHFNAVSPENCLKPERVHPTPDTWDFAEADQYVEYAETNGLWKLGHTLCWHNQTPDFYWYRPDGTPKSREELIETLREHIEMVAGRYGDAVNAWDVVNEIIGEQGEYRVKGWVKAFDGDGYEVVRNAFIFADRYAPHSELYYNDFNVWRKEHVDGIVTMVKRLQSENIRIDGVGIQAHWGLNYPKTEYIEHAIDTLASCGVKVLITELDVDVLPLTKEGQIIGQSMTEPQFQLEEFKKFLDPYPDGMPADVAKQLDDRYAELMGIFYKHRDQIDRVTLWGLTDDVSWKNDYPVPGRTNYPLLFNRDYSAKPAVERLLAIPQK
ncbi:MAG: endo-1,4-beta-xylanase [Bacteroidales bacterium]|nr:endo-1,4-beta-xylanase [Bacteroidales bacterium]